MGDELKRTALYPLYEKYKAKVIDFHGWALPVQFSSIIKEHEAVREKAGLFDVSHMGQVMVEGADAEAFLQRMLTNDLSKLETNQALYTAMCYPDGGVVDDLLVYKLGTDRFFLVLNASNTNKDLQWLNKHIQGKVSIQNISNERALLALQGPLAESVLQPLTEGNLAELRPFQCEQDCVIAGIKALVSRTGYTGEDGFEIYLQAEDAPDLWEKLLSNGESAGLVPCGLGARDTLRFEAGLLLYGQDLSETITPLEAGIGFAVKLNKEVAFIGQEALRAQKEKGVARKLIGLEMKGRGIPRSNYNVFANEVHSEGETAIGYVTSGTHAPSLKRSLALALVDTAYSQLGQEVFVEIRGKRVKAEVIKKPFYRRG